MFNLHILYECALLFNCNELTYKTKYAYIYIKLIDNSCNYNMVFI